MFDLIERHENARIVCDISVSVPGDISVSVLD